ncbi:Outer membrane porin F [Fundidesulfovibrio magnetotacticus]|uniref:Outer membrane porin F n=1 Tax=Fundidesulfovibrio magnetotacticus TaxID=2730080 RepID=A0A6V8LTH7_9BACT|nr:OmpA family protein [Fundidesulfovibrio magnetotacticus]GFK93628.1 Outer membrane porin F [Fundidesulfovibrio magnetotacticus]
MRKMRIIVAMLIMALVATAMPAAAKKMVPKVDNFILFVDHSSSMAFSYKGQRYVQFGGVSKIQMAKSTAVELNKMIPALSYKAGVYTFAPYKQYAGMAPYDKAAVDKGIAPISTDYDTYGRMTPMGIGLQDLDKVVGGLSGKTAVIIFSDGDSNRGIDPVAVAKQMQAKYGDKICFSVVSFADNKNGERINKEIAALSKCGCFALGEELLRNQAARETFLKCALYDFIDDEVVIFRSIYFDFDKYNIKKEFIPVLDEGVAIIKSKPNLAVILEGHTDSIGTEKYNMGLSIRRANSVKAYFVKKGIDAGRITAVGFGKMNPRYDNKTAEGRKMNRRVEIKFKSN